jgi:ribosomal protein S18 acetylase RimI-like enzyme
MTAELVTLKCHEHIRTQTNFCKVFLGSLKAKAIKKNRVFHDSYTGCAKVTLRGKNPLKISRIYLLQKYIGKGYGKILMTRALREAKERNCDSVWLGVWANNYSAIGFYKKLGFREIGSHPFEFGNEMHNDLIMELEFDN